MWLFSFMVLYKAMKTLIPLSLSLQFNGVNTVFASETSPWTVDRMLLLKNKVYMYTFNHRSSGNSLPEWSGDALHWYEIDHVFGVPFRDSRYNDDERTLSSRIITYWTNFAKTGYVREMSYAQYTPPTRLNSTVASRRRRRCVLTLSLWQSQTVDMLITRRRWH